MGSSTKLGSVKHPAKFTNVLLHEIGRHVKPGWRVLDPFAGTGRVHLLTDVETVGVEIEPEWAALHPDTIVADALALPFDDNSFDAIVTSPCYGNRMADHHDAKDGSRRHTYRHALSRPLHDNNSGQMQWGRKYREFHFKAWREASRVCSDRMIVNVSDHIRGGERMCVTAWHTAAIMGCGWELVDEVFVETPRMRAGANAHLRIGYESILVFDRADN